jgi:hypothetical protein
MHGDAIEDTPATFENVLEVWCMRAHVMRVGSSCLPEATPMHAYIAVMTHLNPVASEQQSSAATRAHHGSNAN